MASIHEEEDRILKELSSLGNLPYPDNIDGKYRSYPDHHPSKELIVQDGLHYLGKFSYNGCWGRKSGDEEERWKGVCDQKRGLVVLTKDLNLGKHDPKDTAKLIWDIREDHGRDNNDGNDKDSAPSTAPFYENLRRWIYGLMTMSDSGEMPEYPTNEEAQTHFEEEPWVRMNLKKEAGKEFLEDDVLDAHIEKSKTYLLKQLKLYEGASIYLDCAKGRSIGLLKQMYPDITPFSSGEKPRISYSEEHRLIIIDSHHPSAWIYKSMQEKISEEGYYNKMRKAMQDFFKEHHNFFKDEKASEDV